MKSAGQNERVKARGERRPHMPYGFRSHRRDRERIRFRHVPPFVTVTAVVETVAAARFTVPKS